jgi:NADH dehydrogenase (ubiquinone) Fe-S protein 8
MQFSPEQQYFDLDWESVWDKLHYEFFKTDLYFHGLARIIIACFESEYTINYPQEKSPLSPVFRAEHSLRR